MTDFKTRDEVYVVSLEHTRRRHGVNKVMEKIYMDGEPIRISAVFDGSVSADNWSWDKRDIVLADDALKRRSYADEIL